MDKYDLIILGSGPAGVEIEAMLGDPGKRIAIVEKGKRNFGGTCVNQGCMPTKHLAKCAELKTTAAKAGEYGLGCSPMELDLAKVTGGKDKLIGMLSSTHQSHSHADILFGHGRFRENKVVEVTGDNGETRLITADQIVIATGSRPSALKGIDVDGEYIMNSDQFLNNTSLPENLLIVGGGVIGMEFASIYSTYGSRVTVVEAAPMILPNEDVDTGMVLKEQLEKKGVEIFSNLFTKTAVVEGGKVKCTFEKGPAPVDTPVLIDGTYDQVLVAVGRTPNTDDLGLENTDITLTRGSVDVNEYLETAVPGVFAAGDVLSTMMLAHTAVYESMVITTNMKEPGSMINDNFAVPRVVFTNPEVGGVGFTEREAREKFGRIKVINFPMEINGKNLIEHQTDGRIKLIFSGEELTLVGASIVGKMATEVIHELTLAVTHGLTYKDLLHTIHAHPTTSEIVWFAVFKGTLADSTESFMAMMQERVSGQ